jgi:hypothetical protein
MEKNGLDIITKSAAFRSDPLEIPLDKCEGEFLTKIVGHMGVANRRQQIAVDSPGIALH